MDKTLQQRKMPRLPGAFVYLDKGQLGQVPVAILNASRLPCLGFDVSGMPPNHWRPLEYGPFGVAVAFDRPVEVKVMLDGKVLSVQKLFPQSRPTGGGAPKNLQETMGRLPQPQYVFADESGKPFLFLPRELADLKSAAELTEPAVKQMLAESKAKDQAKAEAVTAEAAEPAEAGDEAPSDLLSQLSTDTFEQALYHVQTAAKAYDTCHMLFAMGRSKEAMETLRAGLASIKYARGLVALAPLALGEYDPKETIAEQIHPGRTKAQPSMYQRDRQGPVSTEMKWDIDPAAIGLTPPAADARQPNPVSEEIAAAESDAELAEMLPPDVLAALASLHAEEDQQNEQAKQPVAREEMIPLAESVDPYERPMPWSPSHGRIAVGVRLLQQMEPYEAPMPPDTYSYAVFQMNPWELFGHAHARLWRRKIVPDEKEMRQMMIAEGFGEDAPLVAAAFCGCGHDHMTLRSQRRAP